MASTLDVGPQYFLTVITQISSFYFALLAASCTNFARATISLARGGSFRSLRYNGGRRLASSTLSGSSGNTKTNISGLARHHLLLLPAGTPLMPYEGLGLHPPSERRRVGRKVKTSETGARGQAPTACLRRVEECMSWARSRVEIQANLGVAEE